MYIMSQYTNRMKVQRQSMCHFILSVSHSCFLLDHETELFSDLTYRPIHAQSRSINIITMLGLGIYITDEAQPRSQFRY